MEKLIHTRTDVRRLLDSFERSYGMSSEDFYARHIADEELEVSRFSRHVWASFWREFERAGPQSQEFAARAERTLALA